MNSYVTTSTDGNDYVYEDMNNHQTSVGWICPKCGRAISPEYKTCPYCSTQSTDENLLPGEQIICE